MTAKKHLTRSLPAMGQIKMCTVERAMGKNGDHMAMDLHVEVVSCRPMDKGII